MRLQDPGSKKTTWVISTQVVQAQDQVQKALGSQQPHRLDEKSDFTRALESRALTVPTATTQFATAAYIVIIAPIGFHCPSILSLQATTQDAAFDFPGTPD